MALKKTQKQLKREYQSKIQDLQYTIFGKCFDCTAFQADGYQDCEITDCPLHKYRLKQPMGLTSASLASYLRSVKARFAPNDDGQES